MYKAPAWMVIALTVLSQFTQVDRVLVVWPVRLKVVKEDNVPVEVEAPALRPVAAVEQVAMVMLELSATK